VTIAGGSVGAVGYTVRRLRSWGAGPGLVSLSVIGTAVASTATFALLATSGVTLLAVHRQGAAPAAVMVTSVAGAVVVGMTVAVVVLLSRSAILRRAGVPVARGLDRLRRDRTGRAAQRWTDLLDDLDASRPPSRVWAVAFGFAAINWLADLLCLEAALAAAGAWVAPGALIAAYVAGIGAAWLPTPGGVGPVEAAVVLSLGHLAAVPAASATAAVITYRLISLVLVAVIGWIVLLVQGGRHALRSRRPSGSSNELDVSQLTPRAPLSAVASSPVVPEELA